MSRSIARKSLPFVHTARARLAGVGALLVLSWLAVGCGKSSSGSSQGSGGSGALGGNSGSGGSGGSSMNTGGANGGASVGGAGASNVGAGGTAGEGDSASGGASGTAGAGGTTSTGGTDAGAPTLPFGHPSPNVTHPVYDGYTLWVVEDFDQPLDLDNDPIWTWSDGGFQTHRFTRDAITFTPGSMTITFSDTPQPSSCSLSNQGLVPESPRTSGELRTRYNLFRYGRYEASIKAPSVQPNDTTINGNYIASLFVFRQPACQDWREIDAEITGDGPNHYSTNLITGDHCNTSDQPQAFDPAGLNFRTGFQTVGFEWLPGKVRYYYLDAAGAQVTVRELTDARVPDVPTKIMANLWVFDASYAFGGPNGANDVFPLHAEYDFIRYYKWNGETAYPCLAMDSTCVRAEDLDLVANNGCDGIPNVGDYANCPQCGATQHVECTALCPASAGDGSTQ